MRVWLTAAAVLFLVAAGSAGVVGPREVATVQAALPSINLPAWSVATINASGTGQATCAPLLKRLNIVTGGSGCVVLPTTAQGAQVGDEVIVVDRGVLLLPTYPPSGATLDGGAVNISISLGVGSGRHFIFAAAAQWVSF